tara:strand:- start:3 stop:380 length:378 start_codon:yes stop_codon:yes gene_type:complete
MRKKAMRNVSIMTKLSTEKVELSLVSDLDKLYKKIKKEGDYIESSISKVVNTLDGRIGGYVESTLGDVEQSKKIVNELIKATKDLGVDIPSNAKTAISQINAYESSLNNAKSAITKAADTLLGAI